MKNRTCCLFAAAAMAMLLAHACCQGGVIEIWTVRQGCFAPYHDGSGWMLHLPDEWAAALGVPAGHGITLPSFQTAGFGIDVIINIIEWHSNPAGFVVSGFPDPRYYEFTDGICDELPGVLVSRNWTSFGNAGAPADDPHYGFSSGEPPGWYTGNMVFIQGTYDVTVLPEPGAMALLAAGMIRILVFPRRLPGKH